MPQLPSVVTAPVDALEGDVIVELAAELVIELVVELVVEDEEDKPMHGPL